MKPRRIASLAATIGVVALACAPAGRGAELTTHEFVVSVAGVQEHRATAVNNDWMAGDTCPRDASSSERMTFRTRRSVRLQVLRERGGRLLVVYRRGRGWGNPYPALVDGAVTRDNAGFLACPAGAPRDCGTLAFKSFQVEILGGGTARRPRWHIQNSSNRGSTFFENCRVARDTRRTPAAFPKIFDRNGSDSDIRATFLYTHVPASRLLNRRVKKFTATGTHSETYETESREASESVRFTQKLTYTLTFRRAR